MSKKYYISDLHIGHENIIRFDKRPFENIDEMLDVLVKNWNERVKNDDTVYILGDFIWKTGKSWEEIVTKFKGHKVLIKGNHDLKQISGKLRKLFDDVSDYKEINDEGRHVVLCHYPILMYNKSFSPNAYMLCGHVHKTTENTLLESFRNTIKETTYYNNGDGPEGNIFNVGCMMPWMDYTPRTLDEIIEWHKENKFGN